MAMEQSTGRWRAMCGCWVAMLLSLITAAPVAAAIKELSNDSFTGLGTVTCQIGFGPGESGAVKLTADPGDYPYEIKKVRMLVCPGPNTITVILRISEDNTGSVLPGPVIYEEIVQITGSDIALNEVDLSLEGIIIMSGSVRVEIEWYDFPPPPGLANDQDGFVAGVNYIYAWFDPPGVWSWVYANQLGVLGDWIIRLEIDTAAEAPIFVDGFESGDTSFWSVTTP